MGPLWAVPDMRSWPTHLVKPHVSLFFRPAIPICTSEIERIAAICAIVRHEDDHRIVELPLCFKRGHNAADLPVHVADHGGINFHATRFKLAKVGWQVSPGWPVWVERGSGLRSADKAHATLAGKARCVDCLISLGISAALPCNILIRSLQRPMRRREIQHRKERFVLISLAQIANHLVSKCPRTVKISWRQNVLVILDIVHGRDVWKDALVVEM